MSYYQNEIVFLKVHNPTLWEELIQYFKKNKLIVSECCHFYLMYLSPDDNNGYEKLTNKMSSMSGEEYNQKQSASKASSITIKGLRILLYKYQDGFFVNELSSKIEKWWKFNKQTIFQNHYNNILNQNDITPNSSQYEPILRRQISDLSESYSNLLNNSNALQTSFDQLKEENVVLKQDITKLSESYSNLLNNSNVLQTSFDQLKEENVVLKKDKFIINDRLIDCIYTSNVLQTSVDQLNKENVCLKKDISIMNDRLIDYVHSFQESRERGEQLENDSNALQTSFDQLKEENIVLKNEKTVMKVTIDNIKVQDDQQITKLKENYSNLLNSSNALQTSFDQLKEENDALQTSSDQAKADAVHLYKENTVLKDNFEKMEKLTEENETLKVENCSLNNKMNQLKNLF